MSELTKLPGHLAAVGAIHFVDPTPDEMLMLATYRALNKGLQGVCLDVALSMAAESGRRHIRPMLKVIAEGAA